MNSNFKDVFYFNNKNLLEKKGYEKFRIFKDNQTVIIYESMTNLELLYISTIFLKYNVNMNLPNFFNLKKIKNVYKLESSLLIVGRYPRYAASVLNTNLRVAQMNNNFSYYAVAPSLDFNFNKFFSTTWNKRFRTTRTVLFASKSSRFLLSVFVLIGLLILNVDFSVHAMGEDISEWTAHALNLLKEIKKELIASKVISEQNASLYESYQRALSDARYSESLKTTCENILNGITDKRSLYKDWFSFPQGSDISPRKVAAWNLSRDDDLNHEVRALRDFYQDCEEDYFDLAEKKRTNIELNKKILGKKTEYVTKLEGALNEELKPKGLTFDKIREIILEYTRSNSTIDSGDGPAVGGGCSAPSKLS